MKIKDVSSKVIDQKLEAGPLQERGCTDIICFILIIASFITMWYAAIYGYANGKPERLLAAYDPDGRACSLDLPGYPYIYFPILLPAYYNYTTCVASCPSSYTSTLNCSTNKLISSCKTNCFNFDFSSISSMSTYYSSFNASSLAGNVTTALCVYQSSILFDRVCYPTAALSLIGQTTAFSSTVDLNRLSSWVNDIGVGWKVILGSFFLAFVLGLIYMVVLRYLGGLFVWITVLLYFVALAVLASYTYTEYDYYNNSALQPSNSGTNSADTAQALKIIFICEIVWIALSFIIFLCIINKIRLAIGVVKTATLYIRDNFSIMLVPPIIGILLGILWAWWIVSVVYIVGCGTITGSGSTPFATVSFTSNQRNLVYFFMFAGLWKQAFLLALNQFIIGCSVCIWYFQQGPGQTVGGSIRKSVYWAFRYHLGSLAFGSFILAVVQFVRLILEYAKYQAKKMSGDNGCTKCILDCLSCLVACFERFIEFLNKNAYIQIALTAKSFCPAAKDAFETIWSNGMRYSLVAGIGSIFTFIGKMFVAFLTVLMAYEIFIQTTYYKENLTSPVVPSIVVFIIAWMVGILFMSIYQMACDAVLTCFIYDEELNKQNGGQSAQHCPETLREWFDSNASK